MNGHQRKCCCRHTDARACLLARHPEIRRHCDVDTGMYDRHMDEVCECACHADIEANRREFEPEPWEADP